MYDIAGDYREILDSLDDMEAVPEEIAAALDALEGDIVYRIDNLVKYIREQEAQQKAIAEEIRRLQARKVAAEKRERWLRDYIQAVMKRADMRKVKGRIATVSVGRATRPALVLTDAGAIPAEYYHTPEPVPVLDREAVTEALKDGVIVPGAELHWSTTTTIRAA